MAKSIQELIQLKKSARAVPTRNVPAIDWPGIVRDLQAGKTLTFKTTCKFRLPKNPENILLHLREHGFDGKVRVSNPLAEVIVLEAVYKADAPKVERSGRAKTGIAAVAKRGPGRPRKNAYNGAASAH